jgi:hypothetical protein
LGSNGLRIRKCLAAYAARESWDRKVQQIAALGAQTGLYNSCNGHSNQTVKTSSAIKRRGRGNAIHQRLAVATRGTSNRDPA